tara:strand:+ start:4193 stop:4639 length:447 start_codon:yes stop_codon:yes gene_type:complete
MAPVGTIRAYDHPDLGYQLLRSVKATSEITANEIALLTNGSSTEAVKSTGAQVNANLVAGIAVSTIAASSYGWVVCAGQAYAILQATAGNGSTLSSGSTAGMIADVAVSTKEHCIIGTLVDNTGSDGVAWASTSLATRKVIVRVNSLL